VRGGGEGESDETLRPGLVVGSAEAGKLTARA